MSSPAQKPRVVTGLGDSLAPIGDPSIPSRPPPLLEMDRRTYARAQACVHCGLCLPVCPTYTENGLEADSPRGRIGLMKGLADGRIGPTAGVLGHLDLCLDCRACETACPSGVVYHELIEETRAHLAPSRPATLSARALDRLILHLFPYPARLKLALLPARLLQRAGLWNLTRRLGDRLLPAPLAKLTHLLPPTGPLWPGRVRAAVVPASAPPATGPTVGLFTGCVASVLFSDLHRQTVELLTHLGCRVVVPAGQSCCGAIAHHAGRPAPARSMALANLRAFEAAGVDLVVSNVAGCGAMLKEYDHLLRDDRRHAAQADGFVQQVRDVTELLAELGPPAGLRDQGGVTVAYHDACHLAHAQCVTEAPRRLLAAIPGIRLVALPESDMCCGAAGTYNLTQPAMSADLARRKLGFIRATGASVCVTANAGCALQIAAEARRMGLALEVLHPVTLLHRACFGAGARPSSPAGAGAAP